MAAGFAIFDNAAEFLAALNVAQERVGFAQTVALTRTARATAGSATGGFVGTGFLQQEAERVFDRPTRYTLGGFYWRPTTPDRHTFQIGIKSQGDKGIPAAKFLQAEVEGGARRQKKSEAALTRAGFLGDGRRYWVPGPGIKLDAYGNVPGSTIRKILSDLQADREAGYLANRTARSSSRNKRYRNQRYFVPKPGSKLAPGVWLRQGGKIIPALLFVTRVEYHKRFDFYGRGMRFALERFPIEMEKALAEGWNLPRSTQLALGLGGRI
jgi:hypothetical protein